jgi:RNA polymerase sigma factor (sigma-70 family)
MAGLTAPGPLERLARERTALVAWLAARFRGRLTYEDCEDVVADALPRLADDPQLPVDAARAGAYLRRALWRDALDELRHRHGRELDRRAPVPLELAAEQAQPDAEPEGGIAMRQEREQLQAAAARMLERLSPTEAKVLRLKFLDDAAPDDIAHELGVTRSQYQRRLTAASRHALDALVDLHSGPTCPQVRRLITDRPSALLDRDEAGRRDAHLDECVHCRAFSLRARGALELLPLPAVGMLERLGPRLGGLLGRGGDSIAAMRDGPELAAGGGVVAGAGTALTVGLGAKVAAGCTGAAVAVLCAGSLGVLPQPTRTRTVHSAAAKKSSHAAPRAARTPVAASTVVATASATVSRGPAAAETTEASARRTATRAARRQRRREAAGREFGPESGVPNFSAPTAATASRAGGEFSAAPPPPRMPAHTAQPASSSSSFGGEFSP